MYTPQVIEHYENPRNVGTIADADGTATVGSTASGEMIKLTLKVLENVIVGAKFRAFGCPTAIASASVLTEMVTGSDIPEALQITASHLSNALGGLPLDKQRYAAAAEEVLKTAIADCLSKTEV
jgi:NifU-like protein involved in Fe-S cluster formation